MGVPDPPGEARSHVLVVLDSCRYDTFMRAAPNRILALGEPERRYSYATWTAPAHYNMLLGLLPHRNAPGRFAADTYREDLRQQGQRLGMPELDFSQMLPGLFLPAFLRDTLGFHTQAIVSMPVINPATPINRGFDQYHLMDCHHDFSGVLDRLRFYTGRPSFTLLNLGETHYPYTWQGAEDHKPLPVLSGLHGVVKNLERRLQHGEAVHASEAPAFFSTEQMEALHQRQVEAVGAVDAIFEQLYDLVPPGTTITVTSDHGELFGEAGFFGHGPISHDKVLEVPFVEGRIRD